MNLAETEGKKRYMKSRRQWSVNDIWEWILQLCITISKEYEKSLIYISINDNNLKKNPLWEHDKIMEIFFYYFL